MVWKSKKSVTGKLTDMKDFASGKWDAISSIAWSNAKSVWSGTSKWFGNAFSSLKGWVGDMYESPLINLIVSQSMVKCKIRI